MGWLKRAASAINNVDPATDLTIALSPSIRRVRKLEERGTPANGVITGIRFTLQGETTRKEFAVTVVDGATRRFGVRTQPVQAHRLRLGVPVVAMLDGDRGILDWDAMALAWGLGDAFLTQDSIKKVPDDGIVDTSLDARVQKHLKKKWSPTEATIVALHRRSVLGMPTSNWDIDLQLSDGQPAVSSSDEVPSYAQWYAAPGAIVPAVVDPGDRSRASIDWPAFALARFDTVGFDDAPPPGSIAAEVEGAAPAPSVSAMTTTAGAVAPPGDPGAPVTLDATLQSWVDACRSGAMHLQEVERAVADWRAAGMCNDVQAAAAVAAARV
jgi:hypothetical protein